MIEPHIHNKIDSPPVAQKDILPTQPITSAPTDTPPNGTFRFALISGTYYLYARINNAWKRVALT